MEREVISVMVSMFHITMKKTNVNEGEISTSSSLNASMPGLVKSSYSLPLGAIADVQSFSSCCSLDRAIHARIVLSIH
jgi:hypothetical protein